MSREIREYWQKVEFDDRLAPQERIFFEGFFLSCLRFRTDFRIGVGTGRMIRLLRRSGCESTFSAVDLYNRLEMEDVDFQEADTRSLPFGSDLFDLTYSLELLNIFPVISGC